LKLSQLKRVIFFNSSICFFFTVLDFQKKKKFWKNVEKFSGFSTSLLHYQIVFNKIFFRDSRSLVFRRNLKIRLFRERLRRIARRVKGCKTTMIKMIFDHIKNTRIRSFFWEHILFADIIWLVNNFLSSWKIVIIPLFWET